MDFVQFRSQSSLKRAKRSKLDNYLDDDVISSLNDINFDILTWWKNNAAIYPTLSRMARDILAIPISTISSELAFSTDSRVVD